MFRWQHDIRLHSRAGDDTVLMSVHNNDNNYAAPYNATTANLLVLNTRDMTATAQGIYANPAQPVYSNSGGNVQVLANGNVFVGQAQPAGEPGVRAPRQRRVHGLVRPGHVDDRARHLVVPRLPRRVEGLSDHQAGVQGLSRPRHGRGAGGRCPCT